MSFNSKTKFVIILILSTSNLFADCDDAKKKCRNECDLEILVRQNGKEIALKSFQSDFGSKCQDSCNSGFNNCEDYKGSLWEKCSEFKVTCKINCPHTIYISSSPSKDLETGYFYDSNARVKCEDACQAGQGKCD